MIRTELATRGDGKTDPIRTVTQFWSLTGELLAEIDPVAKRESGSLSPPLIPTVVRIVAERYGVGPGDIMSDSRQLPVVTARQLSMRLVRDLGGLSYPDIGRAFGRDHSTVMHACEQAANLAVGDIVEDIQAAMAR